MEFVKPDKNVHTFIIGIDFGHGETSADICNIQWEDGYLKLLPPESIEIFNGVNAVKSILLIERNGNSEKYYIGKQAASHYIKNPSPNYSYHSYFKKVPSKMSSEDRNVMKIFMQEVYKQIRRQRSELTDTNHLVYIACPSNSEIWTDEELLSYAKIALDAGIPLAKIDEQSLGIIRESRAAFLKARFNPNSKASIKEGILLIDFGSSTVDLTYYSSNLINKPIDDGGAQCGASNVEIGIMEDLKDNEPYVDKAIQEVASARTAILLAVREAKENFYTYIGEDMEINISLTKVTGGAITGTIEKYYSNDEIKKILSKYLNDVKYCFETFRDTYLCDKPIRLIFLTGGGSNMQFIQEIAKEVFNYKGEFYKETNPSLTISNGIALAGRADLRSAELLDILLNKEIVRNPKIAPKVIEASLDDMSKKVIDKVEERYTNFANSSTDYNLRHLESDIESDMKHVYFSSILSSKFGDVLRNEVNQNILPKLNNIVGDYYPDGSIENISSSRTFSVNIQIDEDALARFVSDSVDTISEGFFEGLAKITGSIAGLAVSAGAAVSAKIFGTVHDMFCKSGNELNVDAAEVFNDACEDLIPDWRDKDTKLKKERRETVLQKFKENKSSYKSSIREKLKESLSNNSTLISDINRAFTEEVSEYIKEQVRKVRLMLN